MELMSRAVVKTRTMRPLPGEITSAAINGATLPVKLEAARRAIAACTDLSELLRYKSQAAGLCAAVRTMKEVGPEMIRKANELMADAWRKGGELLSTYSSVSPVKIQPGMPVHKGAISRELSPRYKVARGLGLPDNEVTEMVRISAAPKAKVYEAVQKSHSLRSVSKHLPRVRTWGAQGRSDALLAIINGGSLSGSSGLVIAHSRLRAIDLTQFQHLSPDERKIVKAKITEIMELLDEMDRLCR